MSTVTADGGWNWGQKPPITKGFDSGIQLPVGPPTPANGPWTQDGLMFKQLLWPYCIKDGTGTITVEGPTALGDFENQLKGIVLKTLGMDVLIAKYPFGSQITTEDAQSLANMLGADDILQQPVITIANDPNSTAKASISLRWDPDGDPRIMDCVNTLSIFRNQQIQYAVQQVALGISRLRTNGYKSYASDPLWFIAQVMMEAAAKAAATPPPVPAV